MTRAEFTLSIAAKILWPFFATLFLGFVYYSVVRGEQSFLPSVLVLNKSGLIFSLAWAQSLLDAVPSFLIALAFSFLIVRVSGSLGLHWQFLLAVYLGFALAFELTTGVTSAVDAIGVLAGTLLVPLLAKNPLKENKVRPADTLALPTALFAVPVLLLSSVLTLASYVGEPYGYDASRPVYMSYQELRSSVVVAPPKALEDISRVYLFGDQLFLNERNRGIHVIDNSNPESPDRLSFIEIPGNTEVSIKNGFLYADSYVDLVTLDIRTLESIQEVNRVEDIFPYDEYQNVPDDVYFTNVDPERGVVVDYRSGL